VGVRKCRLVLVAGWCDNAALFQSGVTPCMPERLLYSSYCATLGLQ
jgi:hypothetical protein